jgi:SpoVK/Ycf46/Vps4 family AAA+-type ATPase
MARADLLKQLFKAYRNSDRELFMETARAIVEEERKKQHGMLATELTRILNNGIAVASPSLSTLVQPPPRDQDRKTPLIEVRHPDRYFKELVLDEETTDLIRRVMREFHEWDVLETNGLRPSNKLLFCGPPGCGKTVTAEAIATELSLPLAYIRFDSVVSSLLGETAANLRKVFEYISQDMWVVLFDEFDAIGRSRDDITEHGEIKRVVNSFLQMLDNFQSRSLIIAATNFEQALDPALWRRFDEIVRFERPSSSQIEELLKKRLLPVWNSKVSVKKYILQLEGSSFGDVERISLDVLKTCALEGRTRLTQQDLEVAMERQSLRKQAIQKSRPMDNPKVGTE